MTKSEFFKQLKKELRPLKQEERKKNSTFYEEYLSDMIEHGMSEAEALDKLGTPKETAQAILRESSPDSFNNHNYLLIGLSLCSALLICVSLCYSLYPFFPSIYMRFFTNGNHSISIIGGADGPTSIFLAGKVNSSLWWLYGLTASFVCITVFYFIYTKKHNKHK